MSDEYFNGAYNDYSGYQPSYGYTETSTGFDWTNVVSTVTDNILIPLIILIGATILLVARSYAKRLTSSVVSKNEAEALEKVFATKSHIVEELSTIVEAAVASNMQMAQKMKENGHKLTKEEVATLNESARKMIMASLPSQITDTDGSLIGVMGGKEALDSLIDSLMEKYVYEYKLKALDPSFVPNSTLKKVTTTTEKNSAKATANAVQRSVTLGFGEDYGAVQDGDPDIYIDNGDGTATIKIMEPNVDYSTTPSQNLEEIFDGTVDVDPIIPNLAGEGRG